MKRLTAGVLLLLGIAGCSGRTSSVGPTPVGAQTSLNLAGTWSGTYTITGVVGEDCVANGYRDNFIGPPLAFVLAVDQTGSSLNVNATDPGSTLSSAYTGTAITTPPIPLYSVPTAPPTVFPYYCLSEGARDLTFASGLINLTMTGDRSAIGTITANYVVRDAGTQAILETMIITASFTIAR